MVGYLDGTVDILLAGGDVREDRCQQIGGASALNLQGNLLAVPIAQQSQRPIGIPAPASFEQGRQQRGLLQDFFDRVFVQEIEDVSQREAVLLGQRNVDSVVGGCGLQFEVEGDAEAL